MAGGDFAAFLVQGSEKVIFVLSSSVTCVSRVAAFLQLQAEKKNRTNEKQLNYLQFRSFSGPQRCAKGNGKKSIIILMEDSDACPL